MSTEMIKKLAGYEAVASCLLGSRITGVDVLAVSSASSVSAGPAQAALAVVAAAGDDSASAANRGGHQIFGQQKTQLHPMWALRGLKPWSDPA